MPELTSISDGTLMAVRSFKRIGEVVWVNTYEIRYEGAFGPSSPYQYLQSVSDAIVEGEKGIHSDKVTIDRVVIASVEPDSVPYNPETFAVFNYSAQCDGIQSPHSLLPLTFCVLVKKRVEFGRSGNILYRGALSTDSGVMDSIGFTIDPIDATRIESALNLLIDNLQALNTRLVLVKLNPNGTVSNVRAVQGLEVRRIASTKKLYNRYFDVANNTGGAG